MHDSDTDIGIAAKDYATSFFTIPFDLTPLSDNGFLPHKHFSGSVSFTAQLREALKIPITVLIYSVFEDIIEVYKHLLNSTGVGYISIIILG